MRNPKNDVIVPSDDLLSLFQYLEMIIHCATCQVFRSFRVLFSD